MVWFVAPSVELCIQQHNVIQEAMPAFKTCLLTGQDNVEKWSDKRVWDAALDGVRITVSTPAILADALQHALVPIDQLALLVFDEGESSRSKQDVSLIIDSASLYQRDASQCHNAEGVSSNQEEAWACRSSAHPGLVSITAHIFQSAIYAVCQSCLFSNPSITNVDTARSRQI